MLNTQVNIGRYLARPSMGFSLTKQIESFNFSFIFDIINSFISM